jgi:hypothetical protein
MLVLLFSYYSLVINDLSCKNAKKIVDMLKLQCYFNKEYYTLLIGCLY